MSTEIGEIRVSGLTVQVVRKDIKNLHIGVYPPNGRVRVAAPLNLDNDAVRLAVAGKLGWIKKHQAKFRVQPRESEREFVSGESHYYMGQRYRLRVLHHDGVPRVAVVRGKSVIELRVRPGATAERCSQVLQDWYRQQLKGMIPAILQKWQKTLGVQTRDWRIKRMKTKWGSCNSKAGRIWINLEIIKKPAHCLEYIIVHELVHLIERPHNSRFISIMDQHVPRWRLYRQELNSAPLAHETWKY
jgi:predicted metal-dependent hydrolase